MPDIKQSNWEERFDKDFVNIGMVVELCYKEETTYGCDDLCNDKIKQFIKSLLAEEIKKAEDRGFIEARKIFDKSFPK